MMLGKLLLVLMSILTAVGAIGTYCYHREQEHARAVQDQQRFEKAMQKAGTKAWGNSAKTIQSW